MKSLLKTLVMILLIMCSSCSCACLALNRRSKDMGGWLKQHSQDIRSALRPDSRLLITLKVQIPKGRTDDISIKAKHLFKATGVRAQLIAQRYQEPVIARADNHSSSVQPCDPHNGRYASTAAVSSADRPSATSALLASSGDSDQFADVMTLATNHEVLETLTEKRIEKSPNHHDVKNVIRDLVGMDNSRQRFVTFSSFLIESDDNSRWKRMQNVGANYRRVLDIDVENGKLVHPKMKHKMPNSKTNTTHMKSKILKTLTTFHSSGIGQSRHKRFVKSAREPFFIQYSAGIVKVPLFDKKTDQISGRKTKVDNGTDLEENVTTTHSSSVVSRSPNEDDVILGMTKSTFLSVTSSASLMILFATVATLYVLRKRRRRNDPERQRLLTVTVTTGIYYNQSGWCF